MAVLEGDAEVRIEDKRRRILEVAGRLFARYGFAETRMDDVAEEAGFGKGTVYRYFGSKEGLFIEVIRYGLEKLRRTIHERVDPIEDPVLRIKEAVFTYFRFFEEHPHLVKLLVHDQSQFQGQAIRLYLENYYLDLDRIKTTFVRAEEEGRLQEVEGPVDLLLDVLMAMVSGVVLLSPHQNSSHSLGEKARVVWSILRKGVIKDE